MSEGSIFPKVLSMTLRTFGKPSRVNIVFLVANHTIIAHSHEVPSLFVTLNTSKAVVNSRESKILMKISRYLPALFVMAIAAEISVISFMRIFRMTRKTG